MTSRRAALPEPQIEYVTAHDGARIATIAFGEGPPLLIAATPPWSHVLLEHRIPAVRTWLDALGQGLRVIRYDSRGTGLSDRDRVDFSTATQVRDLGAVADHYRLPSFALWGSISGGPPSIAYAEQHPERVSHLLLWSAYARGEVFKRDAAAWSVMLRENWELYTDSYAQAAFGWADSVTAAHYAEMTRAAITQEAMLAFVSELAPVDVSASARRIGTPALVMARRDAKYSSAADARELASLIPGARLQIFDGVSPAPFLGNWRELVDVTIRFVASGASPHAGAPPLAALTTREAEVLRLLAGGRSGKEIASDLGISVATAQRHTANIYAKIGARGRVDAVAYAFARGLAPARRPT